MSKVEGWPSRYSEDSVPAPGEEDEDLGLAEHPSLHKMNIEVFPSSEKQSPSAIHMPASEMFAHQPEESFDFSVDYDQSEFENVDEDMALTERSSGANYQTTMAQPGATMEW